MIRCFTIEKKTNHACWIHLRSSSDLHLSCPYLVRCNLERGPNHVISADKTGVVVQVSDELHGYQVVLLNVCCIS